VKAESEAQSLPNLSLPDPIRLTRSKLEKQLGATARAIRGNPEPVLEEALTLRR